ncbi:MAG TPA: hypothetical protein VMD53_10485 [Rhizomicrobium sp.]|nr:hypothetical protein [Rhizomicrobium sp.]
MPRATGSFKISSSGDLADTYSVSGTYTTPGVWRGIVEQRPFLPPDGLQFIIMTGDTVLGPIADKKYKTARVAPCYSAHVVEDYSLAFPDSYRLGDLPSDAHSETAHFAYSSHWSATANAISVHHEFTAHFDRPLCTGETIDEAQNFLAATRKDLQARISLPKKS